MGSATHTEKRIYDHIHHAGRGYPSGVRGPAPRTNPNRLNQSGGGHPTMLQIRQIWTSERCGMGYWSEPSNGTHKCAQLFNNSTLVNMQYLLKEFSIRVTKHWPEFFVWVLRLFLYHSKQHETKNLLSLPNILSLTVGIFFNNVCRNLATSYIYRRVW